jgi:hypothetical protein
MNADSQVKYLSRRYLQLGSYIFKQADPHLKVRINPEKFMESIEYQDNTGQIISPPPWRGSPDNIHELKNQLFEWISHSEVRSSIVPRLFNQDWETVRDGIDEGNLGLPRLVRPRNMNNVTGKIS